MESSTPGSRDLGRADERSTTSIGKSYLVNLGGSGAMLACNLFTGVVSARLLDPDGRGVTGAIMGWATVASFLCVLGFQDGIAYHESRDRGEAPKVLTLVLLATVVFGGLGILVTELLVPFGFAAQTDRTVDYARLFMIWILPWVAYNFVVVVFGSRHRFIAQALMRVGQPFLYAIGLVVLWATDTVGVPEVLAVQVASFALCAVVGFASLRRQSGLGPFDRDLARRSATFGLRGYGSTLGALANTRLDVMVLPAVLIADEIGLYVVAASVSSMVVGLFGSLQQVAFPAAARAGGREAVEITSRAIRLVLASSVAVAVCLGAGATVFVTLLYGDAFRGSVTPLRLLLPGVCFWACTALITGGCKAIGHPGAASRMQLSGVVVTVIGLAVLLPPFGINGAAATSTLSYGAVFAFGLRAFARLSGLRVRDVLRGDGIGSDIAWARAEFRRPTPDGRP